MRVTTEQLLIGFLTTSKAQRGTQAMAFLLLGSEEQQMEMCSYLSENPAATDKEIMEMAQRISEEF